MLKRFIVAVVEGVSVGGGVAAGLGWAGLAFRGPSVVYGAALATGVLVGIVAGKPPWASSTTLPALLKGAVGAFLCPAIVYGARKWLPSVLLNLGPLFGSGPVGDLPRLLLPTTAIAIALLLEIDDAVGPHATIGHRPRRVVADAMGAGASSHADTEPRDR
jgi:hypothetical protein